MGDRITLVVSHKLVMERVSSIIQIPQKDFQLPCIWHKVKMSFCMCINRLVYIVYSLYVVYTNAYNSVYLLCIRGAIIMFTTLGFLCF